MGIRAQVLVPVSVNKSRAFVSLQLVIVCAGETDPVAEELGLLDDIGAVIYCACRLRTHAQEKKENKNKNKNKNNH